LWAFLSLVSNFSLPLVLSSSHATFTINDEHGDDESSLSDLLHGRHNITPRLGEEPASNLTFDVTLVQAGKQLLTVKPFFVKNVCRMFYRQMTNDQPASWVVNLTSVPAYHQFRLMVDAYHTACTANKTLLSSDWWWHVPCHTPECAYQLLQAWDATLATPAWCKTLPEWSLRMGCAALRVKAYSTRVPTCIRQTPTAFEAIAAMYDCATHAAISPSRLQAKALCRARKALGKDTLSTSLCVRALQLDPTLFVDLLTPNQTQPLSSDSWTTHNTLYRVTLNSTQIFFLFSMQKSENRCTIFQEEIPLWQWISSGGMGLVLLVTVIVNVVLCRRNRQLTKWNNCQRVNVRKALIYAALTQQIIPCEVDAMELCQCDVDPTAPCMKYDPALHHIVPCQPSTPSPQLVFKAIAAAVPVPVVGVVRSAPPVVSVVRSAPPVVSVVGDTPPVVQVMENAEPIKNVISAEPVTQVMVPVFTQPERESTGETKTTNNALTLSTAETTTVDRLDETSRSVRTQRDVRSVQSLSDVPNIAKRPATWRDLHVMNDDRKALFNLGFCEFSGPQMPIRHAPMTLLAGKPLNESVEGAYEHPHFGLVGVNLTTHARARYGEEGRYTSHYKQYANECHCFTDSEIVSPVGHGWTRLMDDPTLWCGVYERHKRDLFTEHQGGTASSQLDLRRLYRRKFGTYPIVYSLIMPRPSEILTFDRSADYRKLTLINVNDLFQKGKKDIHWMALEDLQAAMYRRAGGDPEHGINRATLERTIANPATWKRLKSEHHSRVVDQIMRVVLWHLDTYTTVSVTCDWRIEDAEKCEGFACDENHPMRLNINYPITGIVNSWKHWGHVVGVQGEKWEYLYCDFTLGVSQPSVIGTVYIWVHSDEPPATFDEKRPIRHSKSNANIQIVTSIGNISKVRRTGQTEPMPKAQGLMKSLNNNSPMFGTSCYAKRHDNKCEKTLVGADVKVRYANAEYDPYLNDTILPDHEQGVVFYPPQRPMRTRRQFFAALAIILGFATQGVVDYAGAEGLTSVEQEFSQELDQRADENNKRFEALNDAVKHLSGQIQQLATQQRTLSQQEEATLMLLLNLVKNQEQENRVLQQQIDVNRRTVVDLAKAHLNVAAEHQKQTALNYFLFKTIVKAISSSNKPVVTMDKAYAYALRQGIVRTQLIAERMSFDWRNLTEDLKREKCANQLASKSEQIQKNERDLIQNITKHMAHLRNYIENLSTMKPIRIHYVPEFDNISLHNALHKAEEAFKNVVSHPIQTVKNIGSTVLRWLSHPLKLLITIAISAIGLLIIIAILRSIRKRWMKTKQRNELKQEMKQLSISAQLSNASRSK